MRDTWQVEWYHWRLEITLNPKSFGSKKNRICEKQGSIFSITLLAGKEIF